MIAKDQQSALVYMVRIPGFHPGGPGSIPGCGTFLYNKAIYLKKKTMPHLGT